MYSIASRLFRRGELKQGTPMNPSPVLTTAEARTCRLLELPLELQLSIYELVVIEHKPLLVNLPCNSSYRRSHEILCIEWNDWKSGKRHPPPQPALTQTCRAIRAETLPIFYNENVFRACYCSPEGMLTTVLRWLRMIGPTNREMLRHFYFYDRNERQDQNSEHTLESLKTCEVVTELRGRLETMSSKYCCAHLVTFGEWRRMEGQVPLALEPRVPRLRMEGEI